MAQGNLRSAGIALGVVAVAPLTWWLTFAIPDEAPPEGLQYADYLLNPPNLTGRERLGVGLVSLIAVVGGALLLVDGIRSRRFARGWVGVVVPTAGIAVCTGFTYGMVTKAVSGANIGGSMLIVVSFAVVLVLIRRSLSCADRLRSRPIR